MGQRAEDDVIERCARRIPDFELLTERNDDKRFDFTASVNRRIVTFEVKSDFRATSTGNVAIEYFSRGKWSGIHATEADVMVYCIGDTMRMIATKTLRALLRAGKFRTAHGGDAGSGTKMFLVPLSIFGRWGVSL